MRVLQAVRNSIACYAVQLARLHSRSRPWHLKYAIVDFSQVSHTNMYVRTLASVSNYLVTLEKANEDNCADANKKAQMCRTGLDSA